MMSSERRINASRANGAKSRGPVTAEGKRASSRNSLRHGLLSKTIVLQDESSKDFSQLLAALRDEHRPETPTEAVLVENMAVARWRQLRLWSMETAGLDNEIRHPKFLEGDDFPTQAFVAFRTLTDESRALELLNRYEARFDRQFRTSLATLLKLREGKPAPPRDPVKLRWFGESGSQLVADPSAPPKPPDPPDDPPAPAAPLGSFGNPAVPSESPAAELDDTQTPKAVSAFSGVHRRPKLCCTHNHGVSQCSARRQYGMLQVINIGRPREAP